MNLKKGDILKQKIKMELCGGEKEEIDLPIGTEWLVVSINNEYNTCNLRLVSGLDKSESGGSISLEGLEEYYELAN
ncbi:MAG: hypothetical protein KHY57_20010 [Clostridium sp.]|nr:hypothetical protein [Clostridium sp.]